MVAVLNLYIFGKSPIDVSCGGIFTDIILGFAERSIKDSIAGLYSTSNLSCSFPYYLCKMRSLRIAWVVVGNFISPRFNRSLDVIARTRASGKVFAKCTQGTPRMFKLTAIGPLLGFGSQVIVPSQICSTVTRSDRVMAS